MIDSPVFGQGLSSLERLTNQNTYLLRVLTYHRVDEIDAQPGLSPSILSATPTNFAAQMHHVSTHYQPVSIQDVLHCLTTRTPLPPKAVLVTFDDAYYDFSQHVWPVLMQYNIPVVLFVPTAYPDHPERSLWWDKLYNALNRTAHATLAFDNIHIELAGNLDNVYKELRHIVKNMPHDEAMDFVDRICERLEVKPEVDNHILTWAQLEQLAAGGVILAPHTHTHPILTSISVDRAVAEAVKSWEDLRTRFGDSIPPVFAYPGGGANETIAQRLADAGFKMAFTTQRGINDLRDFHPLLLRRINVDSRTSLNLVRTQMLGVFVHMNRFLN